MAFLDSYRQQVALLIRVIPFVAKEDVFALKGGTAINLFVRDMPRLSVDIDLTYLPVEDRAGDAVGPGLDQPDRGIARQLLPRFGQDVQRRLVIVAEQRPAKRLRGRPVSRTLRRARPSCGAPA